MAYDAGLAQIFEDDLAGHVNIITKKMFGGLCFMHRGHMLCGVHKTKDKSANMAMFRVGPDNYPDALTLPNVSELSFTGRPMKGMVEAVEDIFEDDETRVKLLEMALAFTGALPAKG